MVALATAVVIASADRVSALADTRVALVIGNSTYDQVSPLANARRDAPAIAEMLKALGFETTLVQDQSRDGMMAALKAFAWRTRGADLAAIYYAGYGLEADGKNYLIPTDAVLATDDDIEFELVSLDLVLRSVAGARTLRIVMLDASRNNPFLARMASSSGGRAIGRGFATIAPPINTLIAYATKEGAIADDRDVDHSPFAAALLKHLGDPGTETSFVFRAVRDDVLLSTGGKQEPTVYGSLSNRPVYLAPASPETTPNAGAVELPEPEAQNVELEETAIEQRLFAAIADHTFASFYTWRYYAPDGTFIHDAGYGTKLTGTWWIKDHEVCVKFDSGRSKTLCSKPDLSQFRPGKTHS